MSDWHLHNEFANGKPTGGGAIKQVRLLSIIAWIILLIACINFMNLATARSEKKAKEVGVRKVLGAGRNKLITQFIGESLLLSAIAGVWAIIIMVIALPDFNRLVQKDLSLGLSDPLHLMGLMVIIVICGLVAGSYPAFYLSSFNPVKVLKGSGKKNGNAAMIRKGLVVLQFTVSVVFMISTIIIYLQIQHVENRNLGFNRDKLVEIDMQHAVSSQFTPIKEDLLRTGIVENAALADHPMIYGGNTRDDYTWQGKTPDTKIDIARRSVSPEFIATSGMQVMKGRDFGSSMAADSSNIIITQSLASIITKENPIGQVISLPGNSKEAVKNFTVIGVVNDYIYGDMYGQSNPVILFSKPPLAFDNNLIYVRLKGQTSSNQALTAIEDVLKKDNPAYPFQYRFVDDQFAQIFSSEILTRKLSTIFAALAIFISCLGLFSLAAYTAESRIKEIGIRKVLGSSVTGIAGLLSKDFLLLVGISCCTAFPLAAWLMYNWLQNYAYRINMQWWMFAIAGISAMVIALTTISFLALKAALMNPVKSLRTE